MTISRRISWQNLLQPLLFSIHMINHRWHTITINFTIVKPIVRTSPQLLKANLKFTLHTRCPRAHRRESGAKEEPQPVLEERSVVRADVIGFLVSVATPRALGQCWAVGRVANLPSSNRSSRTRGLRFWFRSICPATTCVTQSRRRRRRNQRVTRK